VDHASVFAFVGIKQLIRPAEVPRIMAGRRAARQADRTGTRQARGNSCLMYPPSVTLQRSHCRHGRVSDMTGQRAAGATEVRLASGRGVVAFIAVQGRARPCPRDTVQSSKAESEPTLELAARHWWPASIRRLWPRRVADSRRAYDRQAMAGDDPRELVGRYMRAVAKAVINCDHGRRARRARGA